MYSIFRVAQSLITPPGILLLMMAMGFVIRKECRIPGRLLIGAGFVLLYLACINPVSDRLLESLERGHMPLQDTTTKLHADAIIVLGGGVIDRSRLGLAPAPADASLERVVEGVRLWHALHLPLMFVGDNGDPAKNGVNEAEAMARVASSLGVAERDMRVVGKARNTKESVRAVKEALKGNHIILVTSAFHMMRAAGMFRKQGFDVIPAPCGYRSERRKLSFFSLIPRAESLSSSHMACSEYISIAWYTITGDL
ncbi:MAG TPA: ElyC/SanA/YdcF family protein [Nitrospirota bacterium]|nr:ElyC/SanA/YdcF family protein [Nitrospirota bacterium]